MPGRKGIAAAFAVLIVTAAVLSVLGLRGLASDARRVDERLRAQAIVLARTVAESVTLAAGELEPDGVQSVALRASADGEWPDEQASLVPGGGPTAFLREQIDALERDGNILELRRRLEDLAQRADAPGIAAWALSASAAVEARLGDDARAREALERLLAEHPLVPDERGLARGFAARWALCRLDGSPLEPLAELARDLIAARTSLEPASLGSLTALVLDALGTRDPTRCAELREIDRERQFQRQLRSSWTGGMSNWLASGAPGGIASFELLPDPLDPPAGIRLAFLRAERSEDDFAVVAISGASLARAALERPEIAAWGELGFGASLVSAEGVTIAGAPLALDDDTVGEPLAAPFGAFTARARSLDIDRARREAQRRFRIIAAISAAALLAGALAAWLGIRALGREAHAAYEREQFVSAVTHELQAPLASIRLLAELLEQGGVSEAKVREFGARTVAEADRLSRLIAAVLQMGRLDRGAAALDREAVLVRQLALDTLRQFEPLALAKQVRVKLHPCDESLRVLANRDAVGSSLFELLTNASKYGAHAEIEVALEARGERVVVAVLDRGAGVAADAAERIFEPFQRLGDELTREQPGVGLGLALVRKVAESHGGTARYVPREGGGSRFEIELPRAEEEHG